ncbi:MAG: hypothetical protein OEL53_08235 [Rhodospirillales bacterium]|nr:hypothetical protein [Rhodospirillales bacterium]
MKSAKEAPIRALEGHDFDPDENLMLGEFLEISVDRNLLFDASHVCFALGASYPSHMKSR